MNLPGIIDACERKFRAVGLSGLSAKERIVVLAGRANFEIEYGGMAAFFHNSTKEHAREIVDALVELGAMEEAASINQGRDLIRRHSWEHLQATGQFDRLTDKFLASTPGLFSRLAAFVEQNSVELEGITQEALAG